jgi:antitoxin (DNA-binding transcriptional repressor) of toxin-antitoxin stability system
MSVVRLPDLDGEAASLVRRVLDTGEAVEIEEHGVVVARVVPMTGPQTERSELNNLWQDLDEIAQWINESWPTGVSAQDAIDDVRREL